MSISKTRLVARVAAAAALAVSACSDAQQPADSAKIAGFAGRPRAA